MNTHETWKTIPFEAEYEVSDYGRVRNKTTCKVKSLRYNKGGYLRVTLYPSGKTYTIHQLVCRTYLGEPLSGQEVNHINGVRDDNNLTNLEWVSRSANCKHRDTVLRRDKWEGTSNPANSISEDVIRKIKYGDFPNKTNKEIGEIFGVSREHTRRIRKGLRWKHI